MAARVETLRMNIRSFKEPLTEAIRKVMVPSIRKNFDEGGRPAWEPLSAATLEIRERWGIGGDSPLILFGNLRRTATQINIWTITSKDAMVMGLPPNVWYGAIHQAGYEGTEAPAKGKDLSFKAQLARWGGSSGKQVASIPARPFIVLQPEDEADIEDVFMAWLYKKVNIAWQGKL